MITFDIFKTYLKNALNIEKHIAVNGNRYDTFCETFDAVVKNCNPTCVKRWKDKYLFNFTNKEWETVFILAKTITKYTKIIELQFKIVHII